MAKVLEYIRSDYKRYTGRDDVSLFRLLLYLSSNRNHAFNYSFWLRLSHFPNVFSLPARFMLRHVSNKYSVQISRKCKIGYGLYLGHCVSMVINENTVIGNNVNLSQFLNIGANNGASAIIGDNVYIGPMVCLVGNIVIGDGASVGAGAVVTKDVPPHATVAGVPAKVISYKDQGFIRNTYALDSDS